MTVTTIYPAAKIRTLWPACPEPAAVAVRDGKVLGVGSVESLQQWGDATVDNRFADKVLVPGFVEAHAHTMAGSIWAFPYVGFYDRTDPDGKLWAGCGSVAEVIARLQEVEATMDPGDEPLFAWGLDPIYFDEERLNRVHLDQVSTTRQIFVFHASAHLATVNSILLEQEGIGPDHPGDGIPKDDAGQPTGELQEPAAMSLASSAFRLLRHAASSPDAPRRFIKSARNAGITTIADLGTVPPKVWPVWQQLAADPNTAARVVLAARGYTGDDAALAAQVNQAVADSEGSDYQNLVRFGIVKLILDGSIQGYTARVNWPHYLPDSEGTRPTNGLWLIPPDALADCIATFHEAGLIVHCHTNGDEALDVFLDAVEAVLERCPRPDHRHTAQHAQMATPAQFRRMATLGVTANLFTNHLWFWGDQHRTLTLGEDRAAAMNACRSALDAGVTLGFHSDAPITPLGPLHTMWCAVNRVTPSGYVLGEGERVTATEALQAATLGAAFQLGLDHEIGSIQPGKQADFTILDEDPLAVEPMTIRNIGVWGTVLSGVIHQASDE